MRRSVAASADPTPRGSRCSGAVIGSRSNGAGRPRPEQPRPGDRPLAEATPDGVLGLDHAGAGARVSERSPAGRTAPAGRGHPGSRPLIPTQAHAHPAHLRSGQLERRPPDRLGQVGRLVERPLAGDRPEGRVADLDASPSPARRPGGRSRPETPSAIARSVRSMTSRSAVSTSNVCSWPIDLAGVAVLDRVVVDALRPIARAAARACRTAGRAGPGQRRRGRRSSSPRTRAGPARSARRRPTGG